MLYYRALTVLMAVEVTKQWEFKQNAYSLIYERLEIAYFNPEYLSFAAVKNFKFNRTQAVSNITLVFKKDCSHDVKIQLQTYKFMSNEYEYRTFPIRFSYNFCECVTKNDFGVRELLRCGNFTIDHCSVKKGVHHACNFHPNAEHFPPHVPEGSYKLEVKWFDGPKEALSIDGYGSVKYKFNYP